MKDPANFEELVSMFSTRFKFGETANADVMLRGMLKLAIPMFDIRVRRSAVQASINNLVATKTLDAPLPVERVVWEGCP